jgi:hypothetical protein
MLNKDQPIQHAELLWGGHVNFGSDSVAVKKIQEWLCYHEYRVTIDGSFGKKTQQALNEFFKKPTPVVDHYKFAQLSAPLFRAAQIPAYKAPETLAEAVLIIARQHAVQKPIEIGGPNSGPWVRYYMRGRQGPRMAWCAGFVSTVWAQAARWMGIALPSGYTTSCDWLAREAQDDQRFIAEPNRPEEPCIFLVRKVPGDWVHTGIAHNFGPHSFETIEGNTNDDGSREGVKVCQRVRAYPSIDFARLSPVA